MEIEVKQRRKRSLGDRAITVACVVVTLLALGFLVPAAFGLQRYVITGTSMTGTIDFGSVTYEKVVPVADLRVGDIITYQPPAGSGIDHQVTHRIVSIKGDVFRTKGDAVPQRDPWKFKLDGDQQARVVFSVPYVGYPLMWLSDRGTRMLVIGLPAALIGLIAAGQLVGALRRKPVGKSEGESGPEVTVPLPQQPSVPLHG